MAGETQPLPGGSSVPDPTNSPELIEQFFQLQTKEVEARMQQTQLETLKVEHGAKFSLASLDKQAEYMEREGTNHHRRQMTLLITVGVGVVAILIFLAVIILQGHEQIALELVKIVGYGGVGGAGGYGIGRMKSPKQSSAPAPESDEN